MISNFLIWFGALPFILQCMGYIAAIPIILIIIGLIVCLMDTSSIGGFFDENDILPGLMMLGAMASTIFVIIFGIAYVFSNFLHLPYWLSFIVGLVFGIIVLPTVLIILSNRKSNL